eukprot:396390-Rhodomonas_salina.1
MTGRGQDLAVKGLLNLGRGGEEVTTPLSPYARPMQCPAKAKLASPDVVLSLTRCAPFVLWRSDQYKRAVVLRLYGRPFRIEV